MGQICNKHVKTRLKPKCVSLGGSKWVTGKAVPHKLLLCFVELLFWQRFLRSKGRVPVAEGRAFMMCFVFNEEARGLLISSRELCISGRQERGGSLINRPGPLGFPTLERETTDQKFMKFML